MTYLTTTCESTAVVVVGILGSNHQSANVFPLLKTPPVCLPYHHFVLPSLPPPSLSTSLSHPPSLPTLLSLSYPPSLHHSLHLNAIVAPYPAHPTSVVGGSPLPYNYLTVDSASRDNPVIIDIGMLRTRSNDLFIVLYLYVCRSHQVSNLLLMTTDPPSDWPVRGQGALIQTKACRVKRKVQGDQNAYTLNEVCVCVCVCVCLCVCVCVSVSIPPHPSAR